MPIARLSMIFGDWFYLVTTALMALAVLAFLRNLAIYRQRKIESHELAREAVRMRREFESQSPRPPSVA